MKLMKQIMVALLCGFTLVAPVIFTIGCQTSAPPTSEAIKFYAFQDTWTTAHAAYQGWCERVVQGQVSAADEREVDELWNKFRAAFKMALIASRQDWTAAAPDDLVKLKNDLIIIIRAASL
jgi:hypothetical protein